MALVDFISFVIYRTMASFSFGELIFSISHIVTVSLIYSTLVGLIGSFFIGWLGENLNIEKI